MAKARTNRTSSSSKPKLTRTVTLSRKLTALLVVLVVAVVGGVYVVASHADSVTAVTNQLGSLSGYGCSVTAWTPYPSGGNGVFKASTSCAGAIGYKGLTMCQQEWTGSAWINYGGNRGGPGGCGPYYYTWANPNQIGGGIGPLPHGHYWRTVAYASISYNGQTISGAVASSNLYYP